MLDQTKGPFCSHSVDQESTSRTLVQQPPPTHFPQQMVYIGLLPLVLEVAHTYQAVDSFLLQEFI